MAHAISPQLRYTDGIIAASRASSLPEYPAGRGDDGLVGGVNLILHHGATFAYSRSGMLARARVQRRCHGLSG